MGNGTIGDLESPAYGFRKPSGFPFSQVEKPMRVSEPVDRGVEPKDGSGEPGKDNSPGADTRLIIIRVRGEARPMTADEFMFGPPENCAG